MIYLLDTNAASDWLSPKPGHIERLVEEKIRNGDRVVICQPVYYELTRGLMAKNHLRRQRMLRDRIMPLVEYLELTDDDWRQAARFWADAEIKGRRLSDMDVLIAALAHRLNAVIVSGDGDFDALPVRRENWRAR